MAKSKAISKVTKPKLKTNIVKRKTLNEDRLLAKKLIVAQVRENLLSESPEQKSRKFLTTQAESDIKATETIGRLIKAPEFYSRDQVEKGVKALLEYITKVNEKKVDLFDDEQPLFLQITAVKVPRTPDRQVRLSLKHSLSNEHSEICLIVKDLDKPKDYDGTVEHYQKVLVDNDITTIKTIMPFHQFKAEYGKQFEMKRKFLGLYDYFLVDGRISGYVTHLLGKVFIEKRKLPTSIHMDASNLKNQVEMALKKTIMKIHSKSDSYSVQIGHSKMNENEVFDNACEAIDELVNKFPGGIDNIRLLGLKTDKSFLIPVYLTLKKKNNIKVPIVTSKRPKLFDDVSGELTTYLSKDVKVTPDGKVVLINQKKRKADKDEVLEDSDILDASNEAFEDETELDIPEQEEETSYNQQLEEMNVQANSDGSNPDEVEDDLSEDDLEQAEQMYLNEYELTKVKKPKKSKTAAAADVESEAVGKKEKKKPKNQERRKLKDQQSKNALVDVPNEDVPKKTKNKLKNRKGKRS